MTHDALKATIGTVVGLSLGLALSWLLGAGWVVTTVLSFVGVVVGFGIGALGRKQDY